MRLAWLLHTACLALLHALLRVHHGPQPPLPLPSQTHYCTPTQFTPPTTTPLQGTYGPEWRAHVLAHLPFYLLLLPHFVDLCYNRMPYKSEAAAKDLYRVLRCVWGGSRVC